MSPPESAIAALHHATSVPKREWPAFGAISVCSLTVTVTVAQMLDRLAQYSRKARALVTDTLGEAKPASVANWPSWFDTKTGAALGFANDDGLEQIFQQALEL